MASPAVGQAFSLGGIFGSGVDPELVAKIPSDKRDEIKKAEDVSACAAKDVELAKLKEDLADKQDDLAGQGVKLAKAQAQGAEIALNVAKMEAVIAQNLGKREETTKVLNALYEDRTKNQADQVQIKAKMDQIRLFIRDIGARVTEKEKDVADFKAQRCGAEPAKPAKADAAKADAAKPAPKAEADPDVIVNHEPGAAPEKPKAAPEADLKN
jgi:chromosome segregation ATPase